VIVGVGNVCVADDVRKKSIEEVEDDSDNGDDIVADVVDDDDNDSGDDVPFCSC